MLVSCKDPTSLLILLQVGLPTLGTGAIAVVSVLLTWRYTLLSVLVNLTLTSLQCTPSCF